MSKPVSKSVHQAVQNLLTILANQGDERAIAALQNTDDIDVVDTGETADVQMIVGQPDGEFVITEYGASFLPKSGEE
jgi:hypothetical protein